MNEKFAIKSEQGTIISNPPIAQLLFEDKRFAAVWLVVRVLVGIDWVQAALHKLSDPGWMQTGDALKGFWTKTLSGTVTFDWYRSFLQGMLDSGSYVWFAKLIAIGELLIGIGLIVGLFVGIAAFFGGFMNWNFIMAGSASSNGLLFAAAVFLILAWKTAGYYGLDRYVLPKLGTPWSRHTTIPVPATKQTSPNPA